MDQRGDRFLRIATTKTDPFHGPDGKESSLLLYILHGHFVRTPSMPSSNRHHQHLPQCTPGIRANSSPQTTNRTPTTGIKETPKPSNPWPHIHSETTPTNITHRYGVNAFSIQGDGETTTTAVKKNSWNHRQTRPNRGWKSMEVTGGSQHQTTPNEGHQQPRESTPPRVTSMTVLQPKQCQTHRRKPPIYASKDQQHQQDHRRCDSALGPDLETESSAQRKQGQKDRDRSHLCAAAANGAKPNIRVTTLTTGAKNAHTRREKRGATSTYRRPCQRVPASRLHLMFNDPKGKQRDPQRIEKCFMGSVCPGKARACSGNAIRIAQRRNAIQPHGAHQPRTNRLPRPQASQDEGPVVVRPPRSSSTHHQIRQDSSPPNLFHGCIRFHAIQDRGRCTQLVCFEQRAEGSSSTFDFHPKTPHRLLDEQFPPQTPTPSQDDVPDHPPSDSPDPTAHHWHIEVEPPNDWCAALYIDILGHAHRINDSLKSGNVGMGG